MHHQPVLLLHHVSRHSYQCCFYMCRGTWHMKDHVPLLRRIRWGEVPYGSLRYRNGPENRLAWKCAGQTDDEAFKKFDCNWVGNWIYPGTMKPRKERQINSMNKDEWIDSVELKEVRCAAQPSSVPCGGHCLNHVVTHQGGR